MLFPTARHKKVMQVKMKLTDLLASADLDRVLSVEAMDVGMLVLLVLLVGPADWISVAILVLAWLAETASGIDVPVATEPDAVRISSPIELFDVVFRFSVVPVDGE